jgi:hypothetical protein
LLRNRRYGGGRRKEGKVNGRERGGEEERNKRRGERVEEEGS